MDAEGVSRVDLIFEVLISAFYATMGTAWFIVGALAAIHFFPGRFHL